ncbi:hypothetical protein ABH920_003820 [Catenulispora sp. EB89]|uniref:acyl-CoA dehydrogenase n=1 Tax=Catenulispora sp. EB89 TaxID=3156257 RepID=UPI003515A2CD
MQNTITACEEAGRHDGLAAGLAVALAALDAGAAPGGIAALPASAVPAGAEVIRHEMALAEGIGFVRPATRREAPADELTALAARLGAVRIGATLRLIEQVAGHLSRRFFGGEPVLAKQLVQGTLADALVATETARCALATDSRAAIVDVHDRLTQVDWELARMFGASGYAGRGEGNPARGAYVSRLVANCWVAREGVT